MQNSGALLKYTTGSFKSIKGISVLTGHLKKYQVLKTYIELRIATGMAKLSIKHLLRYCG